MNHPQSGSPTRSLAGFTLTEISVSAVVLGIFAIGLFASVARGFSVIKSSRQDSVAALALEQRIDQLGRATWTSVTSNYPLLDEGDPEDPPDGAEEDPDEPYDTEYDTETTSSTLPRASSKSWRLPATHSTL